VLLLTSNVLHFPEQGKITAFNYLLTTYQLTVITPLQIKLVFVWCSKNSRPYNE